MGDLERIGAKGEIAELAKDGQQLVARLSAFSAADALQWAAGSKLNGRMAFHSEGARVELRFVRGGVVFASSSRRIEAFGRHLFAEGLVDEVDLAAAIVYSRDTPGRIGQAMLTLEVLSPDDLRASLHDHNVNLTTLVVGWTEGWMSARMAPLEEHESVDPKPVDTTRAVLEAARRIDQIAKIRETIPNDEAILMTGSAKLPADAPQRWARVLETHQPLSKVREHYLRVGGSSYRFLESLDELVRRSVLRLETDAAPKR